MGKFIAVPFEDMTEQVVEKLYQMTLDGTCEETGSTDGYGVWAAKVDVTETETTEDGGILRYGPWIVWETADGFASAKRWSPDLAEERDEHFKRIADQYAAWWLEQEDGQ